MNDDVSDELVAGLKLLADLVKKAADEDLKALLSGQVKLAIVPKSWKPEPKSKIPPLPTVRAQLVEASGAASRQSILLGFEMNQTQARKLAKDLGVAGAARSTLDNAIRKIVDYFADSAEV